MTCAILLKALDQHQFETAAATSIATVTAVLPICTAPAPMNVFTEVARQRESLNTSPTSFENSPMVCFAHLDSILQLAPLGCTRPKCGYPHPSIEEVRSNKALLTPLVRTKVDRLTALEQLRVRRFNALSGRYKRRPYRYDVPWISRRYSRSHDIRTCCSVVSYSSRHPGIECHIALRSHGQHSCYRLSNLFPVFQLRRMSRTDRRSSPGGYQGPVNPQQNSG